MIELIKRGLVGLVYITIILGSIFLGSSAFNILCLLFGLVCIHEYKNMFGLKPLGVYFFFFILWVLLSFYDFNKSIEHGLLVISIVTSVILLINLSSQRGFSKRGLYIFAFSYLCAGILLFNRIPYDDMGLDKTLLMFIFIFIWANDTMAYLVGKTFGRRKLYPKISPNKTIEGFVGGLLSVLLLAILLKGWIGRMSFFKWEMIALTVVVFGSLGDLVESRFKRLAGVKDSGCIMPGHGGLLDRWDSIIFVAPFLYVVTKLF